MGKVFFFFFNFFRFSLSSKFSIITSEGNWTCKKPSLLPNIHKVKLLSVIYLQDSDLLLWFHHLLLPLPSTDDSISG